MIDRNARCLPVHVQRALSAHSPDGASRSHPVASQRDDSSSCARLTAYDPDNHIAYGAPPRKQRIHHFLSLGSKGKNWTPAFPIMTQHFAVGSARKSTWLSVLGPRAGTLTKVRGRLREETMRAIREKRWCAPAATAHASTIGPNLSWDQIFMSPRSSRRRRKAPRSDRIERYMRHCFREANRMVDQRETLQNPGGWGASRFSNRETTHERVCGPVPDWPRLVPLCQLARQDNARACMK